MTKFTTPRIPWIFFDLDDTIWNFSENSTLALHRLYEFSPHLRKLFADVEEFIKIYHIHNSALWLSYSRGEVSTHELKTERWRRTLATKQFEVLTAVCEELDTVYLDILAKSKKEMVGAKKLLEKLTKFAIVGVISNGFSATQYKKLFFSGLNRYITRVIVSEELGINKPNHRIFDYAVAETGATKPFIYIGDNRETDVFGALRAGWYAIWMNTRNEENHIASNELIENNIDPSLYLGEITKIKDCLPLIENFMSF